MRAEVAKIRPALVVFDSLPDFLAAAGLEENSNTDCTKWVSKVCQPLKDAGISALLLDHPPKGAKGPRGASAKVAKVDVQWNAEATRAFSREQTGKIVLTHSKDRECWLPKTVTFTLGGGRFAHSEGASKEPVPTSKLTEKEREVLDYLEGRAGRGAPWTELEESFAKSTLSGSLRKLTQLNLVEKGDNEHYYRVRAEGETGAGKLEKGSSEKFGEGSTEPTERGASGVVHAGSVPFRDRTAEPDASDPSPDPPTLDPEISRWMIAVVTETGLDATREEKKAALCSDPRTRLHPATAEKHIDWVDREARKLAA